MSLNQDTLDVLACEIAKRPKDAPTDHEVFGAVRRMTRMGDTLELSFDPEAAPTVVAFAEAERLCCAGIGWDVEDGPETVLRITATPAQLDLFEAMIASYKR
jgi:hypothetical protein